MVWRLAERPISSRMTVWMWHGLKQVKWDWSNWKVSGIWLWLQNKKKNKAVHLILWTYFSLNTAKMMRHVPLFPHNVAALDLEVAIDTLKPATHSKISSSAPSSSIIGPQPNFNSGYKPLRHRIIKTSGNTSSSHFIEPRCCALWASLHNKNNCDSLLLLPLRLRLLSTSFAFLELSLVDPAVFSCLPSLLSDYPNNHTDRINLNDKVRRLFPVYLARKGYWQTSNVLIQTLSFLLIRLIF